MSLLAFEIYSWSILLTLVQFCQSGMPHWHVFINWYSNILLYDLGCLTSLYLTNSTYKIYKFVYVQTQKGSNSSHHDFAVILEHLLTYGKPFIALVTLWRKSYIIFSSESQQQTLLFIFMTKHPTIYSVMTFLYLKAF